MKEHNGAGGVVESAPVRRDRGGGRRVLYSALLDYSFRCAVATAFFFVADHTTSPRQK